MTTFERKTIVSERVMDILNKTDVPISIAQLSQRLQNEKISPNQTTLYRIIEKLKTKKMIYGVTLKNGITYYELSKNHHHHHFFCNICEQLFCLDHCHLDQNNIDASTLLPNTQFKLTDHEFNLYGICDTCDTQKDY